MENGDDKHLELSPNRDNKNLWEGKLPKREFIGETKWRLAQLSPLFDSSINVHTEDIDYIDITNERKLLETHDTISNKHIYVRGPDHLL